MKWPLQNREGFGEGAKHDTRGRVCSLKIENLPALWVSQRPWRPLRERSRGNDRQGNVGRWNILEMPIFIPLPNIPLTIPWVLRKLLISMIIWDNSEGILRHASPGPSRPVQASQTNTEIPDEDLSASKSPELTGRRYPKIGASRSSECYFRMAKIHSDRWLDKLLKKLHLQLAVHKAVRNLRQSHGPGGSETAQSRTALRAGRQARLPSLSPREFLRGERAGERGRLFRKFMRTSIWKFQVAEFSSQRRRFAFSSKGEGRLTFPKNGQSYARAREQNAKSKPFTEIS